MMQLKLLTLTALLACAASVIACSSDDTASSDAAAAHRQTACKQSCAAALGAQCPSETAADCEAQCLGAFEALPNCEAQQFAFIECAGLLVSGGWECDAATGLSVARADVCVAEQTAYATCAQ